MRIIHTAILLFILTSTNGIAQISGSALDFDGDNDHVVCNLPILFNDIGSNDFTIEMWIKPNHSGSCRLMSAQLDENNFVSINLVPYVQSSPNLGWPPTSNVFFYVYENSVNHSIAAGGNVLYGVWSHVAVTWDADEMRADVYVNGSLTVYAGGVFESEVGANNKLTIGSRTDGEEVFKGQMDEFTIWNVAKSHCEIAKNIYNAHVVGPNTAAYYSFNSGFPSGPNFGMNTLLDWATFNYATLSGFNLSGNSSNWVTSGVETYGWLNDPLELALNGDVLEPNRPADMYRWIDCNTDTLIPGAYDMDFYPPTDDPNYSAQFGGNYAVILRQGYCNDTSDCVFYGTTSIDEESILEPSVYPNPSNGSFNIELTPGAEEVQILSMFGQLIEKKDVIGMSQVQFDLTHLNGVYLISINSELSRYLTKISIQNQ